MFVGLLSVYAIVSFSGSLASNSKQPMKCLSLNNQPCETRLTLVDINPQEVLFYSFTVSINKCGGSCDTIDDPHASV